MKTTESSSNRDLQSWILDFLSEPNKVFDNLPPCPFAKKAWLDGNVEVKKFEGFDSLDKDLANWNKEVMIPILLLITISLLVRNYLSHKKKSMTSIDSDSLKKTESKTVQGIIQESAEQISNVVSRTNKIYSNMLTGLAKEDLSKFEVKDGFEIVQEKTMLK